MRETYTSLLKAAKDYVVDPSSTTFTSLSSPEAFLKREINHTLRAIFDLMKEYKLQPLPRTASTVEGQIYYHNPPGLSTIESVTIAIGALVLPLKIVESQAEWDYLQQFPTSTGFPRAIFPRRDDFGLFPTPQDIYTLTLAGNYQPINIGVDDYAGGTVTVTQNTRNLVGDSTSWTSAMVGRWFTPTDSDFVSNGNWYRVSGYTSATSLTIESYFEDSDLAAATYLIGQSPEVPMELHEYIPYRAAAIYYGTKRRDQKQAQRLLNFFYTGDFENTNREGNFKSGVLGVLQGLKEKGRGNSQMTEMGMPEQGRSLGDGIWGTTISAP
jgi:hypothetical protein